MATGHTPWSHQAALHDATTDRATAPAGEVVASASDLARYKFLQVMMNGEDDVSSAEGKAPTMLR